MDVSGCAGRAVRRERGLARRHRQPAEVGPHRAIGIAERLAVLDALQRLGRGEEVGRERVAHRVPVPRHAGQNGREGAHEVLRREDGAHRGLLGELQVAVVAAGEVRGEREQEVELGREAVDRRAGQFEHVRVALLRHDGGAGRVLVRKGDEAELTRGEQHEVTREAVRGEADLDECMDDRCFPFASRKLHRRHVLLHRAETQKLRDLAPGKVQARHAIACRAAPRRGMGSAGGLGKRVQVIQQQLRVARRPEADGRRHGALEMGVAGHERVGARLGVVDERPARLARLAVDLGERVAEPESQRDEHLVVARAARVDLFSHVAETDGQLALDDGVHVLVLGADDEFARLPFFADAVQRAVDLALFGLAENARQPETSRVAARAAHVVREQDRVPPPVLADGEARHPVGGGGAFVPDGGGGPGIGG